MHVHVATRRLAIGCLMFWPSLCLRAQEYFRSLGGGLHHVGVWFMREFGSFHVWEFEKRLDRKFLNSTVVFWPRCCRAPKFRSFGSRW